MLAPAWIEQAQSARDVLDIVPVANGGFITMRSNDPSPSHSRKSACSTFRQMNVWVSTGERASAEITQHIANESQRTEILAKLAHLQAAVDKPSKVERYNQFVGALSDYITVVQFILPPLMYCLIN